MNPIKESDQNQPESNIEKRQWYKLRGNTIKFLQELQFSAGRTTRSIADATFCKSRVAAVILQRMRQYNVIERIEGWGWRITRDGIEFLKKLLNNNNNKYVNSKQTNSKQEVITKDEEKPKIIPTCFSKTYCAIQRFCKEKVFSLKNKELCATCTSDDPKNYIKNPIPIQRSKIST